MSPVVAVVGVGYVGAHLVLEFSKYYPVIAYDVDPRRLDEMSQQETKHQLMTTNKPADLSMATHILISVPTGVHPNGQIDTRILQSAVDSTLEHAQHGTTIVIESSVAVGMTRSLFGDRYQAKDLKVGMSPERVDPGRTNISYDIIPKIVSGIDQRSLSSIETLYREVFRSLVPVSSMEVAEMTKLYENCQRMVSIAYANEMADVCHDLGIDPLEVSQAAGTKPFGYQRYNPGLGVGGHCIPFNPFYLLSNGSWPCLEMATHKMRSRPANIGDRIMSHFAHVARPRILVCGVSFKRGQSVLSNAPGIDLIRHLLSTYDVYIEFCDPLVGQDSLSYCPKLDDAANWSVSHIDQNFDAAVVCIDQEGLDFSILQGLQSTKLFNFTAALPWSGVSSAQPEIETPASPRSPITPVAHQPISSKQIEAALGEIIALGNMAMDKVPAVNVGVKEVDLIA